MATRERERIAALKASLEGLEQDGELEAVAASAPSDADVDAFVDRNGAAIEASVARGKAALARGEGRIVTPDTAPAYVTELIERGKRRRAEP
ncbi:MAG: hypothetical protein IT548_15265 [Alphaproteobacteria bacterium]|nr:hypothetical protein [Alphaproteobacteria bacterium]